jgi:hypothetical protein
VSLRLPALVLAGLALGAAVALGTPRPGPEIVFAADPAVQDGGAVFPDLFAIRPDGTGLRRITRTAYGEVEPAASPDGRWLAFFAPSRGIGVVRPDGSGYRILVRERHDVGPWGDPAWSRDSRWIAFVDDPYQHVWVVRPDGTGLHALAQSPQGSTSPTWSADGKRLLVENGNRELWQISAADGRPLAPVVYPTNVDLGFPSRPVWAPNGRYVAFDGCSGHLCGEAFPLYVLGPAGGLHRLSPNAGRPAWLPDSSGLVYGADHQIVRVDRASGRRHAIFRAPYWIEDATWVRGR